MITFPFGSLILPNTLKISHTSVIPQGTNQRIKDTARTRMQSDKYSHQLSELAISQKEISQEAAVPCY